LFLAKEKIPHIIIDKAVFPRDKICGDALSGKVVEVFKKLDPALIDEIAQNPADYIPSWGVKFIAPNYNSIDIPFKSDMSKEKHAPGFISKRLDFDSFLVGKINKEYAQFWQNTTLVDVAPADGGHVLYLNKEGKEVTVFTKLLVGAEGDRSIVGKKLGGIKMEPAHYCAGIRAYYSGVEGMHQQNFIELHFLDELLPGYFWIFPLPNGMANVGAGILSKSASKKKVNLREKTLKIISENPQIAPRFKNATLEGKIQGWGLPLGSKKRALSGNGFILTGDAGSLIDPFTGEGIGNAMICGRFAAETIKTALQRNDYSLNTLQGYDEAVYKYLWSELKLSHTLQKLCKYPWLFNAVVNKASKNKTLQETISCMFEDLDMRSKFSNPMFYLKILFG
jgi:menaquinone-9 beta-reductase